MIICAPKSHRTRHPLCVIALSMHPARPLQIGTPQAPQVGSPDDAATRAYAERHYQWWESIWRAREVSSLSGRDRVQTATIEYGPVRGCRASSEAQAQAQSGGKQLQGRRRVGEREGERMRGRERGRGRGASA